MVTSIDLQTKWFEVLIDFLKESSEYTEKQIIESKIPDCMAMRCGLVGVLQHFGLCDSRICRISGMTSGQVYRAKQRVLAFEREGNVSFKRLMEILKKLVQKKIKEQEVEWEEMMQMFDKELGLI